MDIKIIFPGLEHLTKALRTAWRGMPEAVARNLAVDLYIVLITIVYLIFGKDWKLVAFLVCMFWIGGCFTISSICARKLKNKNLPNGRDQATLPEK